MTKEEWSELQKIYSDLKDYSMVHGFESYTIDTIIMDLYKFLIKTGKDETKI